MSTGAGGCTDRKKEFDAYDTAVVVSVGLKHEFAEDKECSFKVSEPPVGTPKGKAAPDATFRCDGDTEGIVCEIKSSLSRREKSLLKGVGGQVKKYASIKRGWKTSSGEIGQHSILLLVRSDDCDRLVGMLEQLGGGRARAPNAGGRAPEKRAPGRLRIVSDAGTRVDARVAGWRTVKGGGGQGTAIVLDRTRGSAGCEYFDRMLEDKIKISVDRIGGEYEESKFVRSEPPVLYTMTVLYHYVLPGLSESADGIPVTVDGLMDGLGKYFTSWSGIEGERGQIRRRWVSGAMDEFCNINMAKKAGGGAYILTLTAGVKDARTHLLKKMCGAGRGNGGDVQRRPSGRRGRDRARGIGAKAGPGAFPR